MPRHRSQDAVDKKTGATLKSGRGFTDEEVVGMLIVLLFAGQHTSSITTAWLGAEALRHPEVLAELQAEQQKYVPDHASLKYENLLVMDTMRRSITEVRRE